MRICAAMAITLLLWASTAQPAAGQSALKRLEELIRGNRTGDAAASQPTEAQPAEQAVQPTARPEPAEKGYLGVVADDRKDRGRGVRILEIRPGSPAQAAGLKPQDLITAAAGVRVRQMDDLADVLGQMAPGTVVEFAILRDEKPQMIEVKLGRPIAPRPINLEELHTPPPESPDMQPRVQDLDQAAPALLPEMPKLSAPQPKDAQQKPKESPQDLQALVEALQRRVDELERRLDALESQAEPKK